MNGAVEMAARDVARFFIGTNDCTGFATTTMVMANVGMMFTGADGMPGSCSLICSITYTGIHAAGYVHIGFAQLLNVVDDGAYSTGDYVAITATHQYVYPGATPTVSNQPTLTLTGSQITATNATWSSGLSVLTTFACQQERQTAISTPTAGLSFNGCGPIFNSNNPSDNTAATDVETSFLIGQNGRVPWVAMAGTHILVTSCHQTSSECVATATVEYVAANSPQAPPPPYSGPVLLLSSGSISAGAGDDVTIKGDKLETVSDVEVGKIDAEFSTTPSSLTLTVPTELEIGTHDIDMTSSFGKITIQDAVRVTRTATIVSEEFFKVWTKLQSGNKVKMHAKNPMGEGKIQFLVNGEEIAWVNAVDETDPKLNSANGASYLVRTVDLEPGKNRFEIKQDGQRIWFATYVPKG